MRYPASEKLEIIRLVEQSPLPVKRTLEVRSINVTDSQESRILVAEMAQSHPSDTDKHLDKHLFCDQHSN